MEKKNLNVWRKRIILNPLVIEKKKLHAYCLIPDVPWVYPIPWCLNAIGPWVSMGHLSPSSGLARKAMELGDWLEVVCDFDRRKVRSGPWKYHRYPQIDTQPADVMFFVFLLNYGKQISTSTCRVQVSPKPRCSSQASKFGQQIIG